MKFLTAILAIVSVFAFSACASKKESGQSCCAADGKCAVKHQH